MITLDIESREFYDETKNEFIYIPSKSIELEHSLISVSKWEAKWKRPFLSETKGPKTEEEFVDYIRCMTITKNVDPMVYYGLTQEHVEKIVAYLEDKMSATWFNEKKGRGRAHSRNMVMTSEVIYWQMITLGIPMECEKWHLNRLLTLIRVCNEKGEPPKKMSNRDLLGQYASVNKARRAGRRR